MDPISQACLGASLAQSFSQDKSQLFSALLIGSLAGMAPDLDVLIRSSTDPILFLEYHRQFTHSLFFIPFGALICAIFFYPFFKSKLTFKSIYLFSILGFATHGLLDACTSYGTQLFWPFSDERVAWNVVSIVDPFFTLPVTILCILAVRKKSIKLARAGFIYAVLFLSLGLIQHHRAETAAYDLAEKRGHKIDRLFVKPSFANRHVWKIIYETDNRYYIDAVRLLSQSTIIEGDSILKLNVKKDFPQLPIESQQAIDIERFRWFSDDYLALSSVDPNYVFDVRYSFLPNSIAPMWGIYIDKNAELDEHVKYNSARKFDDITRQKFIDIIFSPR